MQYLARRIGDKLEEENKELKGLGNLKAVNIKKAGQKGPIQMQGEIKDFLKDEDHLICELDSYEIWLKATIKFTCKGRQLLCDFAEAEGYGYGERRS